MSNESEHIRYIDSPIGAIELRFNSELELLAVEFKENEHPTNVASDSEFQEVNDVLIQLTEYFKGTRTEFSLKLAPQGTDFQKRVWKQLQEIPFGKTTSYQKMANELGDPKVIRAAASANGKNPISIIIPCHRVIGSDGSLTGYASGLHRKKWLLDHENPVKQQSLF
jgi:methylated-DNA-[protein]-cysteine S-methyltransferase